MVPGEDVSWRRYWLMLAVVLTGFLWWLGPVLGLFVVDPMIQLTVSSIQVRGWVGGLAARGSRVESKAPRPPTCCVAPSPPPSSPSCQVITPKTDCFDYKRLNQVGAGWRR